MQLTKEIVIQARILAWEGKKISDISKILKQSQSNLYAAIKGETWVDIKDPPPFDKSKLKYFTCGKCNLIFLLTERAHGKICKLCRNIYKKSIRNPEKEKIRSKQYRDEKLDKIKRKQYLQKYRSDNLCKLKKMQQNYYQLNKKDINLKRKIRDQSIDKYIIISRMRKSLRRSLNKKTIGKFRHLNYSKQELYDHLIMTLPNNLSIKDCHIDHIIPISSFKNVSDPESEDFKKCWALNNLRLISAHDNLVKSSKIIDNLIMLINN